MVDIISILVLLLLFLGLRFTKNPDEYLSYDNSNAIKGLFIIFVVLHHLSLLVSVVDGVLTFSLTTGFIFPLLTRIGFLCVAVFFFLSGYGSYHQLGQKGESYLHRFLSNKFWKIALPFIVVSLIYFVFDGIVYGFDRALDIFWSISNGTTLVANGWYIVTILILYLFFYLSFRFSKQFKYQILIMSLLTIAYMIAVILLGFGAHWYQNCLLFVVGILWKRYETSILAFIRKKTWLKIGLLFLAFFAVYAAYAFVVIRFEDLPFVPALFSFVLSLIFVPLVMLIFTKVTIGKRLWAFLGSLSLEIYMIHGLVYNSIRLINLPSDAGGNLLFVGLSVVGAIILSLAFYYGKKGFSHFLKLRAK